MQTGGEETTEREVKIVSGGGRGTTRGIGVMTGTKISGTTGMGAGTTTITDTTAIGTTRGEMIDGTTLLVAS